MSALVSKAKDGGDDAPPPGPLLDHPLRMNKHYGKVRGGALAGAVTYFGFLSFFPLIALIFSIVGYVSAAFPDAQEQVVDALNATFPGLIGDREGQIQIQPIIDAKAGVGILG